VHDLKYLGMDIEFRHGSVISLANINITATYRHVAEEAKFWREFDEFHAKYISPEANAGRRRGKRVRIAILDTGVDKQDPFLARIIDDISYDRWERRKRLARRERQTGPRTKIPPKTDLSNNPIKAIKSFVEPEDEGIDTCGHGSQTAWLLLRVAPEADIYVAKITSDIEFDNTNSVVKVR